MGIHSRGVWFSGLALAVVAGLLAGFVIGAHWEARTEAGTPAAALGTSIVVNGRTRTYEVHLPAGHRSLMGLPLLFAFHGGLGTDTGMDALTHLNAVADQDGFAVVYPQGVDRSWNDGRGNTPAQREGVNDVAFVEELITHLGSLGADTARVYATGISNGAMFTEYLGCQLANELAGIAPVSGPMPTLDEPGCHPSRPLTVLFIEGTADPIVPYGGGQVDGRDGGGTVISAVKTAAFWRTADSCTGKPQVSTAVNTVSDGTSIQVSAGTGCSPGTGVEFVTVTNGGHTWPDGLQYLPASLVGKTTRQFDASVQIADCFGLNPQAGPGQCDGSSPSSGQS